MPRNVRGLENTKRPTVFAVSFTWWTPSGIPSGQLSVIRLQQTKKKEVLSASLNHFQSLTRCKRIVSYWNASQARLLLLLLLTLQYFCQFIILILIAYRNVLIKLDAMQPWKVFIKKWKVRGRVYIVTKEDSLKKNVDLSKRYLSLSHLFSNNLKRPPKSKNWFCNICRIKSRNQDQS